MAAGDERSPTEHEMENELVTCHMITVTSHGLQPAGCNGAKDD